MKRLWFLLFCFQCCAMEVPSQNLDTSKGGTDEFLLRCSEDRVDSADVDGVVQGRAVYAVSMRLFHAMYEIFCSKYLGEDEFFETYEELDPPTQENGMLDLKTRYLKWAGENGVHIPNNGCSLH